MRAMAALGLLACAVGVIAQGPVQVTVLETTSGPNGTTTKTQVVSVVPRCPVGMHVLQGSSMQMVRTADGTTQPLMTPKLTLTPWDGHTVVGATVTVHGFAPHAGTLPLTAEMLRKDGAAKGETRPDASQARPEVAQTLALKLKPDEGGAVSAEMALTGFGIVKTVELVSLTYGDRSTWKVAADSGCSVEPDPLLLVAGR